LRAREGLDRPHLSERGRALRAVRDEGGASIDASERPRATVSSAE